jgi:nucleoside-diphosphate-sugar epimerase
VSDRALTLRGFAQAVAGWFGQDARLRFVPFDEFRASTDAAHADTSWEHLSRSHSMSIEKARRMLGYAPRYTSLEAVAEAVIWLQTDGRLSLGGMAPAL